MDRDRPIRATPKKYRIISSLGGALIARKFRILIARSERETCTFVEVLPGTKADRAANQDSQSKQFRSKKQHILSSSALEMSMIKESRVKKMENAASNSSNVIAPRK